MSLKTLLKVIVKFLGRRDQQKSIRHWNNEKGDESARENEIGRENEKWRENEKVKEEEIV